MRWVESLPELLNLASILIPKSEKEISLSKLKLAINESTLLSLIVIVASPSVIWEGLTEELLGVNLKENVSLDSTFVSLRVVIETDLDFSSIAKDIAWFPYILAISAILFAFSTMISWSYYGLKSWTYLFGKSNIKENLFKFIFCLFVIIGSSLNLGSVVDLSDSMIFLMALFNIVGVYLLASKVKKELNKYLKIKFSE